MLKELEQNISPECVIMKRDVPCWYEISWKGKIKSLELKIHPDFIQNSPPITDNNPMLTLIKHKFKLPDFYSDFSDNIGFGKIFKNAGVDQRGMLVFQTEIPKLAKPIDEKCRACKGDKHFSCTVCFGVGKEISIDWKTAFNLSASLNVLTRYLSSPSKETSANFPQLITLRTKTDNDQHGGSLWGKISQNLHNHIKSLNEHSLNKIITPAMVVSYQRMFFSASFLKSFFVTERQSNGGLSLNCFGDRSGIFPDEGWSNTNEGYEFTCHNVDSPMQQIALIAGLAALHDSARKAT